MTSTASQQNQIPAQPSSASAATSYASAAGAKKPTPTPLTGSHPPVVVGSAAPVAQNGKSSASPVNGRPNIPPAVPSVGAPIVRSGSSANGGPADHSRQSSVTIMAHPAHGANGGPVVGGAKNIQFGFNESPAIAQSTLHQASEGAPRGIPIPGVPSPAQSPSPIPQVPQQSGGQRAPSSSQAQVTFGSFPGEGDRHMKQHSISHPLPMGQGPHVRRDSQASAHGESVGHVGPGHTRGGFHGQGRGRGGGNFNPQYNNANMGFPPRPYQPNAGRGGMAPPYQGRGGFPNSPQPSRASPATAPANLHHTPTMPPATLTPSQQPFYPQGMNMYPHHQQQVKPPFNNDSSFKSSFSKRNKGNRRDSEKQALARQPNSSQKHGNNDLAHRPRTQSKRWGSGQEFHQDTNGASQQVPDYTDGPPGRYGFVPWRQVPMLPPTFMGRLEHIDLSPEHGDFENQLLTAKQKQMNAPYNVGPPPVNNYGYPMMQGYQYAQQPVPPYMGQPPQTTPGFHQPHVPQQYGQGQPVAASMSRNPSQVSSAERPGSSTGQSQAPPIAQGTPQQRPAQPHQPPAIVSSGSPFTLPRKSKGIVIKDAQGKVLDLSQMKAPSSPSPSIQQSKTPPIVSSTPTPPPKSSTPSHGRTDSTSIGKTAEQLRNEMREQIQRKIQEDQSKEEEAAKAAAEEKSKEEERVKAEEKAAAEKKAAEEAKAKEEAEAKAKAEAEEKAKAEEKAQAEAKAKADAEAKAASESAKSESKKEKTQAEIDEEEMERVIREMEEEDARREKAQAEITAKKQAEAAEAKKREEENKKKGNTDEELRRQEREMERIEEERERQRKEKETSGKTESVADLLAKKIDSLKLSDKETAGPAATTESSSAAGSKSTPIVDKLKAKPLPLNLAPINTKSVEAPQPSAALQSLRSSRFLPGVEYNIYPEGIASPNPALNSAVQKKGKVFKYDAQFLLQFQKVFTEQPSLEFHQQVKTLIGDSDGSRSASARTPGGSGRQNSRANNTSGGFPAPTAMGHFVTTKPLPAGTTSAERFAMSQSSSGPAPRSVMGGGGMAFGRGSFPGQLGRAPSSTGPGGVPNSPRQGSRRGGGSKRGDFGGKSEAQAAKVMPLTAGMEIKPVTTSATGWKPTSLANKSAAGPGAVATQTGHLDPEMVQRKVKAALNKMTPEKFDKISDQILAIAGQSKNEQDGRTLRQVIQLTFEKATDEAHWASMYAKFCKRMLEMMSPEIRDEGILDKQGNVVSGGALFRKYLLNRCQEEFERGWKIDLPEQKEGKAGEAVLLSDEYYVAAAAKRRGLGLVQFIGELYKLGMLTERIMHECVRKLLEFQGIPDEAEIESLTKLLRTIGYNLDSTEKGRPMMEVYFQRIDSIMQLPDLPSRLKFMLMDVCDLRRARWASKDTNKGPKTLEEIRSEAEAAAAQKAAESARNQRGGPGGRPGGGRDNRNFSYTQPAPNTVGMDDLRRLKGTASRSSSQNVSFGPTSMFSSRSNSGRRMGGPGGAFGRGGEDSGASSRTGTPPVAHTNAFGLLADTGDHPASPPSTSASPAMSKATLDTVASGEKKE